ncbi:MAG: LbtU family siderophore porin [Gammaproteobacteria bacterium]
MNMFKKKLLPMSIGIALAAGAAAPAQAGKIEDLEAMMVQMQAQMEQMRAELAQARSEAARASAAAQTAAQSAAEGSGGSGGGGFAKGVSVSGLIDVQTSHTNGFTAAGDAEDSTVAEASITIDAALNDWVSGTVTFLAEEGTNNDGLSIDEALIAMAFEPVIVDMGRTTVFGAYESNMISDPLTLELGEISATIVRASVESGGFGAGAYLYNGDANEAGDDADDLNHFGLDLGYAWESGDTSGGVGIGYVSNIADSGGGENVVAAQRTAMVRDVPGLALNAGFSTGPFSVVGEYVKATRAFDVTELAYNGNGAEPSAWNLEGAYAFQAGNMPATFAIGIGGTDEGAPLGLAEHRLITALGFEVAEGTTVAVE